jgi:hypothetical protein
VLIKNIRAGTIDDLAEAKPAATTSAVSIRATSCNHPERSNEPHHYRL